MKRISGFTLIELLVVVAVIAVLIAILMPALAGAKEAANQVKCAANMRGIHQAIRMYAEEFQNCYPAGGDSGPSHGTHPSVYWFNNWVAYSMLFTGEVTYEDARNSWGISRGIWDCPSNTNRWLAAGWAGNYTYNEELGYDFRTSAGQRLCNPYQMPAPDGLLVLTDAKEYNHTGLGIQTISSNGSYRAAGLWHKGKYNVMFLDGHVSLEKPVAATGFTMDGDPINVPEDYFPQGRIWYGRW